MFALLSLDIGVCILKPFSKLLLNEGAIWWMSDVLFDDVGEAMKRSALNSGKSSNSSWILRLFKYLTG
jgi:hypothetical protein